MSFNHVLPLVGEKEFVRKRNWSIFLFNSWNSLRVIRELSSSLSTWKLKAGIEKTSRDSGSSRTRKSLLELGDTGGSEVDVGSDVVTPILNFGGVSMVEVAYDTKGFVVESVKIGI